MRGMQDMTYYKREVSLMDERIFPRESLDLPIENPNPVYTQPVQVVEQTDDEIVRYVVSDLQRMQAR
jgi:hypothetical protein